MISMTLTSSCTRPPLPSSLQAICVLLPLLLPLKEARAGLLSHYQFDDYHDTEENNHRPPVFGELAHALGLKYHTRKAQLEMILYLGTVKQALPGIRVAILSPSWAESKYYLESLDVCLVCRAANAAASTTRRNCKLEPQSLKVQSTLIYVLFSV